MAVITAHALISLHQASKKASELGGISGPDVAIEAPDPSIFDSLPELPAYEDHAKLPEIAECAVHLKLLHAFYHLRRKVLSSNELDEAFDIRPHPKTVYRTTRSGLYRRSQKTAVKIRDETFEQRRAQKWSLYLVMATARFLKWAEVADLGRSNNFSRLPHLPPIDVLMVWHGLLLNPKWLKALELSSLQGFKTLEFPWREIHEAIPTSDSNWPFNLPKKDSLQFSKMTGLSSDLYTVLLQEAPLLCPNPNLDLESGVLQAQMLVNYQVDPNMQKSDRLAVTEVKKDLADAVTRQSKFIDKMEKQLWLRSPALKGTLTRAVDRYSKFVELFRLYPDTMLVPTLDIDLVWHTHQCSPARYREAMMRRAGRFIDHNDKLGSSVLDPGMDKTRDFFRIRFGEEYKKCLCWDCEALLSAFDVADYDHATDTEAISKAVHLHVASYRKAELKRRSK